MLKLTAPVALVFSLVLAGCASVRTQKIGGDGNPTGPNGIRFYLPRPYVVVTEPFVVGSDVYLLRGRLTPDSQYVVIDDADQTALTKLERHLLAEKGRESKIPAASVLIPPPVSDSRWGAQASEDGTADGGQSDPPTGPATGDGGTKPPEAPKAEDKQPSTAGKSDEPKTGVIDTKVENDPNAYSITPLKRYIDIAWLPDFDEQYVVTGRAGLGNASIGVRLGQGWSLQGLETSADNASLTGPLAEIWGDAIRSLYALAKSKYALPAAFMGAQGGGDGSRTLATVEGGLPVTIKLTIARVAAPGLYPILKPKELACLTNASGKDPLTCLPREMYGNRTDVLLPVPPLTNVAFNVYELIVLEAARPAGDSITGIQRYFDPASGTTPQVISRDADQRLPDQSVLDRAKASVNAAQQTSANRWEIQSITPSGDRLRVVVKKVGSPTATQRQLLASSIATALSELDAPVPAQAIDVVEPN